MTCQCIGFLRIQRLLPDHDRMNTACAGNLHKSALIIEPDRAFHIRIDRIAHAGYICEAPVLVRIAHRTDLQHIQNLLSGHLRLADHVAIRHDCHRLAVGNVTRLDERTQSAAVEQRYICIQNAAVGIRAEISDIRLSVADTADTGLRVGIIEPERCFTDLLRKLFIQLFVDFFNLLVNLGIHIRFLGALCLLPASLLKIQLLVRLRHAVDQLCPKLSVCGDRELSDLLELRTGLCHRNRLAVGSFDLQCRRFLMRMCIDDGIDALDMGSNLRRTPFLRDIRFTEMCQQDHIIRVLLACGIDAVLHTLIQRIVLFLETVDIDAVLILEKYRRGFGKRLRCRHTDKGNLLVAGFQDFIGIKNRLLFRQISDIAADIAAFELLAALKQRICAKFKFMIAGDADIIADCIHERDDILALRQRTDRSALDGITRIHEEYMLILCLQLALVERKSVIADIVIHCTMNVVRIQDHDVIRSGAVCQRKLLRQRQHRDGNHRRSRQADPLDSFHF